MKILKHKLFVVIAILFLQACEKKQDFLRNNVTSTAVGAIPVSTNAIQDYNITPLKTLGTSTGGATVYSAGSLIKPELQYFSISPVQKIDFYNTIGSGSRTLVNSTPYAAAYSNNKKLDTILVNYTIPTATSGTVVKLEYEIVNVNTLKLTRTVYVKVQ